MADESKRKLQLATIVYWVLLLYIIAALIWWFLSLYRQNEMMYQLQKEHLQSTVQNNQTLQSELTKIESLRKRNISKYIGEGSTFLALIIVGAVYIYRSVRRQLKLQRQQQNFVMAITHELKTPIAVSRLNLETLQKYKLDDQKKEKLIQTTLQETLRLDNLINNILISSQLDVNSYHIEKEELNFSDLTNDVACQFATRYADRKFIRTIEEDIDINGDPLLLKLLISNLLENANKYSAKEKPIQLLLTKENTTIQLQVKDEGEGIDEKEKKNIFKKFYRIGNEQTRKSKGTGLGLYLCKKIADDHHAKISVRSNQPQGSIFEVCFLIN